MGGAMSGYYDWIGQNIPDQIMEDAASWLALLDSASCTRSDRLAFAYWLNGDPLHQGAFEELSEVWARLQTLIELPALIDHPDVIPFPAEREIALFDEKASAGNTEWSTLAASLLIVVGVIIHSALGAPRDLHATETGEIQTILLVDGTRVELNALSIIEVRVDGKRREILLNSGEALFHVQEDERPFIVRTDLATVYVVLRPGSWVALSWHSPWKSGIYINALRWRFWPGSDQMAVA